MWLSADLTVESGATAISSPSVPLCADAESSSHIPLLFLRLPVPVTAVTLRDSSPFLLVFPVISCGTVGLLLGQPGVVQYKNISLTTDLIAESIHLNSPAAAIVVCEIRNLYRPLEVPQPISSLAPLPLSVSPLASPDLHYSLPTGPEMGIIVVAFVMGVCRMGGMWCIIIQVKRSSSFLDLNVGTLKI
ncbi:LOW QUALITY PROTEIN: uncharacterized protein AB9W97_022282 [Spinachia spinachia]